MPADYVNLNETGALTQAGQGYDTNSQDGATESRNFRSRMDQSQIGLRGRSGLQFTNLTTQHAGNLQLLGQQIANQAYRAVKGEQTLVATDDEAFSLQQAVASNVDTQTTTFNRPINFA